MCGEIFNESGYKVIVRAFVTQQPAPIVMEEQGQPDWKDGEAPQERLQQKKVADEQDANTQEPTSLNILAEIATQVGTDEPEDEVIPDFVEEICTMTPEPSQDIELIGMEPQQQNNDEVKQDADTQEPTSLNVLVQVAVQLREEELGIEDILELNEEICTMTPELFHDTEILEMESQQQEDE